jgi:hypothetical protein
MKSVADVMSMSLRGRSRWLARRHFYWKANSPFVINWGMLVTPFTKHEICTLCLMFESGLLDNNPESWETLFELSRNEVNRTLPHVLRNFGPVEIAHSWTPLCIAYTGRTSHSDNYIKIQGTFPVIIHLHQRMKSRNAIPTTTASQITVKTSSNIYWTLYVHVQTFRIRLSNVSIS